MVGTLINWVVLHVFLCPRVILVRIFHFMKWTLNPPLRSKSTPPQSLVSKGTTITKKTKIKGDNNNKDNKNKDNNKKDNNSVDNAKEDKKDNHNKENKQQGRHQQQNQ